MKEEVKSADGVLGDEKIHLEESPMVEVGNSTTAPESQAEPCLAGQEIESGVPVICEQSAAEIAPADGEKLAKLSDSDCEYNVSSLFNSPLTANFAANANMLHSGFTQDSCVQDANQERFAADFARHFPGNWQLPPANIYYEQHFPTSAPVLPQHFFDVKNVSAYMDVPSTNTAKPGIHKEALTNSEAHIPGEESPGQQIQVASPGELVLQGAVTPRREHSRKRKKEGRPSPRKTPLEKKMDHLDKEKERRLRQTKSYEMLRELVPVFNMKTDKANMLEVTVDYLHFIKKKFGAKMQLVDKEFLEEFAKGTSQQ